MTRTTIFAFATLGLALPTILVSAAEKPAPDQIRLPEIDGPKPWSEKPILNGPDRFQFAVMTDNTGGHRPGIWLDGIRHVNLLRPEFVVSVGDLIEGYTEDKSEIEAMWKEFLAGMESMQMRFFFVPGNHDLSNPVMHKVWKEKFGREWYSFDYHGVHFLCLSSEDPKQTHMSDEQVEWIEKDLAEHADARWTFAFMHKPLWVTAEQSMAAGNGDPTNWKKVEALLKDRPHTVFAGHVHHYVQYDRNGTNYYHLATTGGASQLRGVPYGEFDHVTWVTMEADGPRVAHVRLGGVLAPDIVTEPGIARFRKFLDRAQVRIVPVLGSAEDTLQTGKIRVTISNRFETPIRVSAVIQNLPLRGLLLNPERIDYQAAAGEERELVVDYSFQEPVPIDQLNSASLVATIQSVEDRPLSAETSIPIAIDRQIPLPKRTEAVVVDGKLDEWKLDQKSPKRPILFGDTKGWNGAGDASVAFTLGYDDENLYFAGRVTDDRVVPGRDRMYLRLDARPMDERLANPRYAKGCYRIETSPAAEGEPVATLTADDGGTAHPVSKIASRLVNKGYEIEMAIPLANIVDAQGDDWKDFQFTVGLADVDEGSSTAYLLWRGSQGILERNTNFGTFVRKP